MTQSARISEDGLGADPSGWKGRDVVARDTARPIVRVLLNLSNSILANFSDDLTLA